MAGRQWGPQWLMRRGRRAALACMGGGVGLHSSAPSHSHKYPQQGNIRTSFAGGASSGTGSARALSPGDGSWHVRGGPSAI